MFRSMVVFMVMMVTMRTVGMTMVMVMVMVMAVHVAIAMFVPIVQIRFAMCMRVFIEDQGLDGHRHRVGRHSDAPQINEIKAPKGDAIDHQNFALHAVVFLNDMA